MANYYYFYVKYHPTDKKFYAYEKNDPSGTPLEAKWHPTLRRFVIDYDGDDCPVVCAGTRIFVLCIRQMLWRLNSSGNTDYWFRNLCPGKDVRVSPDGKVVVAKYGASRYADAYLVVGSSGPEQGGFPGGQQYPLGIAVDADYIYLGGQYSPELHKINRETQAIEWTYDHGHIIYGLDVDSSGNVYICGTRTGSPPKSIWKLNSAGEVQASYDTGSLVRKIRADNDGNVYAVGSSDSSGNGIWRFDASLSLLNSYYGSANGVDVDANNVYVAAAGVAYKLTKSLVNVWTYTLTTGYAIGIAVDGSGNVCVVGEYGLGTSVAWYLNSSGVKQWDWFPTSTKTISCALNAVDFDGDGNIWLCGETTYSL